MQVEKGDEKRKRWVYVLRDTKKKTNEIFEMEQKETL